MSRRRRNQSEPDAPATDPAPDDYASACVEGATEIVDAVRPAPSPPADPLPALRAEYERLAAEVSRAKPTDPGYKELREAKRLAFAAWYVVAHP